MKYKRIVFVTSHPIQYQVPIFKKLSKLNKYFSVLYDDKIKNNVIINDVDFKKKG